MKLRKHGPRAKYRARRLWHPWIAWFPVRVGPKDVRWLETVERKVIVKEGCLDYYTVTSYRTRKRT